MSIGQNKLRVPNSREPLPIWVVGLAIGLFGTMLVDFVAHFQEGLRRATLSALGWVPLSPTFSGANDLLGVIMCVFIAWVAYRSFRDRSKN